MSQRGMKTESQPGPTSDAISVRRSARVAMRGEPSCGNSTVFGSIQTPVNEFAQPRVNRAVAGTSQSGHHHRSTRENPRPLVAAKGGARKAVTFAEPAPPTPSSSMTSQTLPRDFNVSHVLGDFNVPDSEGSTSRMAGAGGDNHFVGLRNPELQYNQMEHSEMASFMKNVEVTDCSFCYNKLNVGEGVMLQVCLHVYCRECLQSAIETQKELTTIPCPVSDMSGCGGYITDGEVKEIVRPEVYEEYADRSVNLARKKMKNVFQCVTPNCKGWCEYEMGRKTFLCPLCCKSNCMACQADHDGLTCEIYQSLKNTGQLAKVDELMDRERRNGWSQLVDIMKTRDTTADLHMILQQIDSLELLENCTKFECSICMSEVDVGEGAILKECLHLFCKDCLTGLVEHNDEPTIKCPYIDGNYSCICFVQEREIKHLVPPNIYEKHLERSVKLGENSMENTFHCKTPDCRGWCVYDEGVRRFDCEICGKPNCISCNVRVIHEGISCDDYKNRIVQNNNDKMSTEAVQALIDSGNAMRCPKCKIPVEKVVGCDWLQCVACKTEICWATKGPRWGPLGKGDISGGCRCMVGGKRCRPNCGNCH